MSNNTTQIWMDGGPVAEKTNRVINTLIKEMNRQEAYTLTTSQLDTVIQKVAGVGTDETLSAYRERVARHGPFTTHVGKYTLNDDYRDEGDGDE